MKQRDSKYFGKYKIEEQLDEKSKKKLKKYYEDLKTVFSSEKKTKQLASYIKKLLSK